MGFAMASQMMQQAPGPAGTAVAPPPLPGSAFHVALGGQSQGPFPISRLGQLVAGGQITPATLVWASGMAAWTPAGQVPQLSGLFGSAPPPPLPAE